MTTTQPPDITRPIALHWWERALLIALVAISAIIAVSAAYPPMNDASSHLGTAVVADRLAAGDEFTAEHYVFDLIPVPYWVSTGVLVPLLQFVAPMTAFDLLVLLYILGLPGAYYWLLRTAAPENTPMALIGALTIFCWAYWLGESNFFLGQPVLLLGFTLFLRLRRLPSLGFAGFLLATVVVYFCHVFALVGLLAAIGGLVIRDLVGRLRGHSETCLNMAQWVAAVCGGLLFCVAAWFILFQHGTEANQGQFIFDWRPYRIARMVQLPLETMSIQSRLPPLLFAAAVAGILIIPRIRALLGRGWRGLRDYVNPVMLWPAAMLFGLAYLGPAGVQEEFGFEDIGQRFTLATWLFALGAVKLTTSVKWRAALVAATLLLGGLKVYDAWVTHRAYDDTAQQLSGELLAQVPEQSRLLPLLDHDDPSRFDLLLHRYGNYVVIERHGYSPHLFARTGQQPLQHRRWGDYRVVFVLDVSAAEWNYYDFVLVQSSRDTPAVPGLVERADLVARSQGFHLYRLRKSQPASTR